MMKRFIYICFIWVWGTGANAQDLHSSNIQYLSQLYNPALTALQNEMEVSLAYRTQWRKVGSPFNAFQATFGSRIQPYKKAKNGYFALGFNAYKEQMGEESSVVSFSVASTYHLKLSKQSTLSFGMNYGYYGIQFNQSGTWESQHNGLFYDGNIISGESFELFNQNCFDLGSGLVFSINSRDKVNLFQLGASAYHLNKPNVSLSSTGVSQLPIRSVLFSSFTVPFGRGGSYFEAKGLYQNQHNFNSLTVGGRVKIKLKEKSVFTSSNSKVNSVYAGFGAYLRNKDAVIVNLSFQKTNWSASLAYDITVSSLKESNHSKGATEIQLWFTIPSFNKH